MREKQRLNLRRCQPCELRLVTIDEPPSPAGASIRNDRHAGRRERIHVAQHGPFRNLEALGELTRGEQAVNL